MDMIGLPKMLLQMLLNMNIMGKLIIGIEIAKPFILKRKTL